MDRKKKGKTYLRNGFDTGRRKCSWRPNLVVGVVGDKNGGRPVGHARRVILGMTSSGPGVCEHAGVTDSLGGGDGASDGLKDVHRVSHVDSKCLCLYLFCSCFLI